MLETVPEVETGDELRTGEPFSSIPIASLLAWLVNACRRSKQGGGPSCNYAFVRI